jgi:hypothetical protein
MLPFYPHGSVGGRPEHIELLVNPRRGSGVTWMMFRSLRHRPLPKPGVNSGAIREADRGARKKQRHIATDF